MADSRGLLVRRLWDRDASLFASRPEDRAAVSNRLGWLDAPESFRALLPAAERLAGELRREGVRRVALLGMGGSSLCPLVFSRVFPRRRGYPALTVLDTTSPGTVEGFLDEADPASTFVLVSSKSGSTIEVTSLYAVLREWIGGRVPDAGSRFAAITDPGTSLELLARESGFRQVFNAPSDVGGRFSALTAFGMVPAALLGLDVRGLLDDAGAMAEACRSMSPAANPGLLLGGWMADRVREKRDKLYLLLPPGLESFGSWLEQLLAESTGKEGTGLLPVPVVEGSAVLIPGPDRACVRVTFGEPSSPDPAGLPVLRLAIAGPGDLGAEFFRWEVATAVTGAILGINPFDEPNVTESKRNTMRLLEGRVLRGGFAESAADATLGDADLRYVDRYGPVAGLAGGELLGRYLAGAPGEYLAILAYLPYGAAVERALERLRERLAIVTGLPVTLGFGPRYLHSTGQFHKGGPPSGRFLILHEKSVEPLPVVGQPWDLGDLHRAQALGDAEAMIGRGRPVLRVALRKVLPGIRAIARSASPASGR